MYNKLNIYAVMNGVAHGWRVLVECCVFTSKSFSALASDPTSSFSENTIKVCVFPSLSPWCFWVRKEIESEYNQLNFLKINNALIKPISLPKTVLTWRVSLSAIELAIRVEIKMNWLFCCKDLHSNQNAFASPRNQRPWSMSCLKNHKITCTFKGCVWGCVFSY